MRSVSSLFVASKLLFIAAAFFPLGVESATPPTFVSGNSGVVAVALGPCVTTVQTFSALPGQTLLIGLQCRPIPISMSVTDNIGANFNQLATPAISGLGQYLFGAQITTPTTQVRICTTNPLQVTCNWLAATYANASITGISAVMVNPLQSAGTFVVGTFPNTCPPAVAVTLASTIIGPGAPTPAPGFVARLTGGSSSFTDALVPTASTSFDAGGTVAGTGWTGQAILLQPLSCGGSPGAVTSVPAGQAMTVQGDMTLADGALVQGAITVIGNVVSAGSSMIGSTGTVSVTATLNVVPVSTVTVEGNVTVSGDMVVAGTLSVSSGAIVSTAQQFVMQPSSSLVVLIPGSTAAPATLTVPVASFRSAQGSFGGIAVRFSGNIAQGNVICSYTPNYGQTAMSVTMTVQSTPCASGLQSWQLAVIVVGCVVGAAAVGILCGLLIRYVQKRRTKAETDEMNQSLTKESREDLSHAYTAM